ncbi:hypothetical protein [Metabacillus iocasae]|uniref:Uncharacterized protein n=1 Tax=Priestia iocasae TaxID=2291674 RepID=A0ABS2QVW0_9BACI|nr:hypothetical protein [Metabacillus iocasae]MBM7703132.1 hypothetical protein [Metabacillus iocasae]
MRKQVLVAFLVVGVLFFSLFGKLVFQEGNPIPVVIGLVKLANGHHVAQIDKKPKKYIVTANDYLTFIDQKEKEGWAFHQQIGDSFIFKKEEAELTYTSYMFTENYTIMKENKK